jgi:hypothetical protein
MDRGRIVEHGTDGELFASGHHYQSLAALQARLLLTDDHARRQSSTGSLQPQPLPDRCSRR